MVSLSNALDKNLISVDKEFAFLLDVDKGFFFYKFTYNVNHVKAISDNASQVEISVFKDLPTAGKSIFVEGEPLVCSILLSQSRCKDIRRFNKISPIARKVSDFTQKISNETIEKISTFSKFGSVQGASLENFYQSTQTSLGLKNTSELQRTNQVSPIYQTSQTIFNTRTSLTSQEAILNLILGESENPFSVLQDSSTVSTTNQNIAGTFNTSTTSQTGPARNAIFSSFSSGQTKATTFDLSADQVVPVLKKSRIETIKVGEILKIPINSIENKFYVKYRIFNNKDETLQIIIQEVDHATLLNFFNTPTIPPLLSISSPRIGINNIEIKQIDKSADKVFIYKRIFNGTATALNEVYELLNVVNLKFNETTTIRDNANTSRPSVYRAAAAKNKNLSSKYSIALTDALLVRSYIVNYVRDAVAFRTSGVLTSRISPQSIELNLGQIPVGVDNVTVSKMDLTSGQTSFSLISNDPVKKVDGTNISFLDKDTKDDHTYQYKVDYTYRNGTTLESAATSLQTFKPLNQDNVSVNTGTGQKLTTANGNTDIQFSLDTSQKISSLDIINKTFNKIGLDALLGDGVGGEAETTNQILVNTVERTDLTTGKVEDFGVIVDNTFSDQKYGDDNRVSPLNPNHDYEYKIRTLLRSPRTILPRERDVITPLGKKYCFSPRKFLNPKILEKGTISEEEINAEEEFELGDLGNQVVLTFAAPEENPEIIGGIATHIGRVIKGQKANQVKWQISGDKSKIDSFIIGVERLGVQTIAGVVHNVSETATFKFIDELDEGEIGTLVYTITPVYRDYSSGKSFRTNQVIVRN